MARDFFAGAGDAAAFSFLPVLLLRDLDREGVSVSAGASSTLGDSFGLLEVLALGAGDSGASTFEAELLRVGRAGTLSSILNDRIMIS